VCAVAATGGRTGAMIDETDAKSAVSVEQSAQFLT